jgi:hypothetical protein
MHDMYLHYEVADSTYAMYWGMHHVVQHTAYIRTTGRDKVSSDMRGASSHAQQRRATAHGRVYAFTGQHTGRHRGHI